MKRILIILEDKEHEQLIKAKGEKNWHDFLLTLIK